MPTNEEVRDAIEYYAPEDIGDPGREIMILEDHKDILLKYIQELHNRLFQTHEALKVFIEEDKPHMRVNEDILNKLPEEYHDQNVINYKRL